MQTPLTTKLAYEFRRHAWSDAMYSHTFNLGSSIVWLEALPKGASRDQFIITLHSYGRDPDQKRPHHYKTDLLSKGWQVKVTKKEAEKRIRDWETEQLNDLISAPTAEARFKGLIKTQLVTGDPNLPFSAPTGKAVSLTAERKRKIENQRLSQRPTDVKGFAETGIAEIEKLLDRCPQRPRRDPNPGPT